MLKKWWWIAPVVIGVLLLAYWYWPRGYCRWAERKYGLRLKHCPDGRVLQEATVSASQLKRGGQGTVEVDVHGIFAVEGQAGFVVAVVRNFDVKLFLVDAEGKETPLPPKDKWRRVDAHRVADIVLPEVRDGDYLLRARVKSKISEEIVDVPLALYAPARIHVLTDRPIYEPGNEVRFRAVALRARDLTPIDHRPGTWLVRDPEGRVLLEEKAAAGEWGVVSGSFPLDALARQGVWSVSWRSGDAEEGVRFRVEPFTVPRFSVEATPDKPYYGPGDRPRLSGMVSYSSGAPVAGAEIEIEWDVAAERWPAPSEWTEGALPTKAKSGRNGRFELVLPAVPADLQEQATLAAEISAVDETGDSAEATASVLLSQDRIAAGAITELEGGLVESFNNRVYIRVTTADGQPLPGARVNVKRAWSADDEGIDAELDADSVARIQLDPGPPVNVVIPALPYRPSARSDLVSRTEAEEHLTQEEPSLADQVAMDRWNKPLEACAKWVTDGPESASLVLQVSAAGAIAAAVPTEDSAVGRCAAAVLLRQRLPAGKPRLLEVGFELEASDLPELEHEFFGSLEPSEQVSEAIGRAALDARDCMPRDFDGLLGAGVAWRVREGAKRLELTWLPIPAGKALPARVQTCLRGRFAGLALEEEAEENKLGLIMFTASPADAEDDERPQPTIMRGYELLVTATKNGEVLGSTKLRMQPGEIPPLRLRTSTVLAKPGEVVAVELIRGPSFSGELPEEVVVEHQGNTEKAEVDKKSRTARVAIPQDGGGWYAVSARGERALIFVRSDSDLAVSVVPERKTYAPGQTAKLAIRTEAAGKGAKAAVGVFGVDGSLGQIVALPGADDLSKIRPPISMAAPAFGVLEAQALVLGRIRGDNAAEATILQVSAIPRPPATEAEISGQATSSSRDRLAEVTEAFYAILGELHAQTRAWEQSAPEGEQMTPETMARLWNRALDACAARGQRVEDAFGRRLRLHRLPRDLLELTDPRQVVVVGTRLPEDVENWVDWVEEEEP